MNLRLDRTAYEVDGIFGHLMTEDGKFLAMTLEHSYLQPDGSYTPKLSAGVYACVRGSHQLHSMQHPFVTFEITKVPGHSNILFHAGNFNDDSEGCVLLGELVAKSATGVQMITNSRKTFEKFMELQKDVNEFTLTAKG